MLASKEVRSLSSGCFHSLADVFFVVINNKIYPMRSPLFPPVEIFPVFKTSASSDLKTSDILHIICSYILS